jgi:argininosuccinate lyase
MPQKHNPYALSMIRGATGVVIGHVTGLLAVQKSPSARSDSLIFAYGEVPLLLDQMRRMTDLSRGVVETLSFNRERLQDELMGGFSQAADLAEQVMLRCDLDYRTAYQTVGTAVREVAASGRSAVEITTADLDAAAMVTIGRPLGLQPSDLVAALDPAAIVATRRASGGAAAHPMQDMIADVRAQVEEMRAQAVARAHRFDTAEEAVRRLASDIARSPSHPIPGGPS